MLLFFFPGHYIRWLGWHFLLKYSTCCWQSIIATGCCALCGKHSPSGVLNKKSPKHFLEGERRTNKKTEGAQMHREEAILAQTLPKRAWGSWCLCVHQFLSSVAKTKQALTLGGSHIHIKTQKSHQAQRDPECYSFWGSFKHVTLLVFKLLNSKWTFCSSV